MGDLISFKYSVSLIQSFKNYIIVQVFDTKSCRQQDAESSELMSLVLKTLYSIFRRVIYANKGDIFGHWDAEWSHTWSDLKEKPKRSAKGVEFLLKVSAMYCHTEH